MAVVTERVAAFAGITVDVILDDVTGDPESFLISTPAGRSVRVVLETGQLTFEGTVPPGLVGRVVNIPPGQRSRLNLFAGYAMRFTPGA